MAEMVARFKPGQNVPGFCTAQVEAGRFLAISGPKTPQGDYSVAHCGAGLQAFGVSERNSGPTTHPTSSWTRRVNIARRGAIARVEVAATITVTTGPVALKSDATGKAIPQGGTGVITGYALHSAAVGEFVEVDLV